MPNITNQEERINSSAIYMGEMLSMSQYTQKLILHKLQL